MSEHSRDAEVKNVEATTEAQQDFELDDEALDVIDQISGDFLTLAINTAKENGWPEELLEPYAASALELYIDDILSGTDPDAAFDDALDGAMYLLCAQMYASAQEEGETPESAFLGLLYFEQQLAACRGEPEVKYLESWVDAALSAVAASSARGEDPIDQIDAGYNALAQAACEADAA